MTEPIDLSEVISATDTEIKRLGWTPQKGRDFLIETYGKRSRTLLSEEELLDFLRYLKYLPTPESKLDNPTPITLNQPNTHKTTTNKRESIDLSEVIVKTDIEMERLGWTPHQGREYLIQAYSKRGRTLLTEEELLDFLQHLESIPTSQAEFDE